MKVLCVGPMWRGSNAGGLFRAMNRQGCYIDVVDEFYYISLKTQTKKNKILERFIRPLQIDEFNKAIKAKIEVFKPDVLFIYKGAFVQPQTIDFGVQHNAVPVLFFPDVSLTNHGTNIPACLPKYERIFTTKTFGITDLETMFNVKTARFIPHGYDPDIHRKLNVTEEDRSIYGCEVSFIGAWSLKKEQWLSYLKAQLPNVHLRIWGGMWHRSNSANLKDSIMGRIIEGDLYSLAIQCSTVNLGILSEVVQGASSGDKITSRTFHIPGANGFMLHERNEESVQYFVEDVECGFFDGEKELVEKVSFYLAHPEKREAIKNAGHERTCKENSLDARALVVMADMRQLIKTK